MASSATPPSPPLASSKETAPPASRRLLRRAAALCLAASSAFVLLSSSSVGGSATSVASFARQLQQGEGETTDPLLTNLAVVTGTTTAAEVEARAKKSGGDGTGAASVTPVYWHIYKAGGTTFKGVLSYCLDLTVASNVGVLKGHDQDKEIGVMKAGGHNYVNVDTVSHGGIDRAARLGLAQSGLADVVVSPLAHHAVTDVFSLEHKGLLFTVFRHPVDRLVSQYYYVQVAEWEAGYNPDVAKESLGEYAKRFDNRMMRQLVGKDVTGKPITESDLDLAKEVVRTRMIVGLVSDMEGSVRRLVRYLGLKRPDGDEGAYESCMEEYFAAKEEVPHGAASSQNRHDHPKVEEGSEEWNEIAKVNEWDIRLYDYVLKAYEEQKKLLDGQGKVTGALPEKFSFKDLFQF